MTSCASTTLTGGVEDYFRRELVLGHQRWHGSRYWAGTRPRASRQSASGIAVWLVTHEVGASTRSVATESAGALLNPSPPGW
jgi:hypothetical protein